MIKTGLNKRIAELEVSMKDMDRKNRNVLCALAEIIRAIENGIEFEVAPEVEDAFERITEMQEVKVPNRD